MRLVEQIRSCPIWQNSVRPTATAGLITYCWHGQASNRGRSQQSKRSNRGGEGMASSSKMLIYPVVNFQISRCLWQAASLLSLLCKWTRSLSTLCCLIVDASLRLFHICGYLIYVRAFNLFSARRCAAATAAASWCTRHSGLVWVQVSPHVLMDQKVINKWFSWLKLTPI